MKTENIKPGGGCIGTFRFECKIEWIGLCTFMVHGDVGEFSKTGAKSRASVIDWAKIMLFPAKDAIKMPKKCSKMLAVLVSRRNAILAQKC